MLAFSCFLFSVPLSCSSSELNSLLSSVSTCWNRPPWGGLAPLDVVEHSLGRSESEDLLIKTLLLGRIDLARDRRLEAISRRDELRVATVPKESVATKPAIEKE